MPTNDQDLRALAYLARRLRDETHGCRPWDDAGTFACLKDTLAGHNLAISIQRVLGHATDPEAKTPGAIKRPYVPEPNTEAARVPYDPRKVCHICGHRQEEHNRDTHDFLSVEAARTIRSSKAPDSVRAAIADGPKTWPKPDLATVAAPAAEADTTRAETARQQMHGATTSEETTA